MGMGMRNGDWKAEWKAEGGTRTVVAKADGAWRRAMRDGTGMGSREEGRWERRKLRRWEDEKVGNREIGLLEQLK